MKHTVKGKQKVKTAMDAVMLLLLPFLMAYELIGEAAHEWIGIGMFTLFVCHHMLNFKWYRNLRKGRYSAVRILGTAVNGILFFLMLANMAGGIMVSRHLFVWLPMTGGAAFGRTLHMTTAYWGFVMMAFHTGIHGSFILNGMKKAFRMSAPSKGRTAVARVLAAGFSVWGIFAFSRRQIGAYLFQRVGFAFFDYGEPFIYFWADYMAIMFLFVFAGYYTVKLASFLHRTKRE